MLKHCHGTNFQCIISITVKNWIFWRGKLVWKICLVCFLPQFSRFKRKGSRSVRIIGYVLSQRKENITYFSPQKCDKKSTFTELLKCYSAFPLSCVTVLSFQSARVVVCVYWFWINKIQTDNLCDFLSQSPDFCLNYHTDKPNMYFCVILISDISGLHWSVLNTPVCHQLRVLEVQVDLEGLVRPACLGLFPLAFCSPQVRYQPRLAGTDRTRPVEGSGAGGGVDMYGKIKRMGTICKNFQHLPFHPSSQGD